MRFTIVSPVLNGMPWLPEAIESVAAQRQGATFELEHLVLDGGSTDGSREWLKAHVDLGYTLVMEPDDGQTAALRAGFERATGELFGWLNSDDILEPGALQIAHDILAASPDVVLVSGACLFIDANGRVFGAMPPPPVATHEALVRVFLNPPQPSTFFRAETYRSVGGLDTSLNLTMDLDLWLKLTRAGRYVVLPDRVLARYRVHANAKSERMALASVRQDLQVRRRYGMPWRSHAGRVLVQKGYVKPVVDRIALLPRAIGHGSWRVARRIVMGPRRA